MNEFSVTNWDILLMISPEDGESWERYAWLSRPNMFVIVGYAPYNDDPVYLVTMTAESARRELMKQLAGSWQVAQANTGTLPWAMPTAEEIVVVGVEEGICDAGRLAELLEEAHE